MKPETPILAPETPTQQPSRKKSQIPAWRLWVPLALQTLLILAVPARDAYTMAYGTRVILQTAPVDPYDMMRGYYQTLRYDISQIETLQSLPGGDRLFASHRRGSSYDFYVVLEPPEPASETASQPPTPWVPVRVSEEPPANLAENQIALRGQYRRWQITYGLETYYMPENQREQVNATISQIQQDTPEAFVVEVKIDDGARAVPVSLWVGDRNYQF
ncbi:GDYXXLXY domain-containing protein [Baaleninema sp.]|uniref:GDYXXLXY domain-containing protein n=1 Tax=Baaleninema sp. TaxID=3101197 RepID=UPI003D002FFB